MRNNIKSKVTKQSKKRMAIKVNLIKTEIEKIKPSDTRAVYYDEKVQGFALRVMPSGAKTFFFQGRMVLQGQDPRPDKNEIQADTFGDLLEAYCSLLDSRGKQSAKVVRLQIHKHIRDAFPKIWKKSVSIVDLDDCMDIVAKIVNDGKPRQADKIRSNIRTAYSEAINPGIVFRYNVWTSGYGYEIKD